jgi:hypothetical protein
MMHRRSRKKTSQTSVEKNTFSLSPERYNSAVFDRDCGASFTKKDKGLKLDFTGHIYMKTNACTLKKRKKHAACTHC